MFVIQLGPAYKNNSDMHLESNFSVILSSKNMLTKRTKQKHELRSDKDMNALSRDKPVFFFLPLYIFDIWKTDICKKKKTFS